jgi:tetratricopeptide (TPR) repeat protein
MANQFLCVTIILLATTPVSLSQVSNSSSQKSSMQRAAEAISVGKLDQAETELQAALRSSSDELRALDLLAVVRILQHREPEAEKLLISVVQKDPNFAPGQAHLGLLYLQMRRPLEAVPHLREAVRIDPSRSDAIRALVRILQDQSHAAVDAGDAEKALALLNEARKYAPDDAEVQFEFGSVALHLSLQQDAVKAFEKTLQLRKSDPLALYDLGRAFMGLSKFEEARQQFAEYVKLRPGDPSGYCALGMTLAALERTQEARAQFNRSIDLAPTQTESYYRLALLELESRELEAASGHLRKVLDREPANAPALAALGKIAFHLKEYNEAIRLLRQATGTDGTLREAHYYLGLAFARTGHKQESDEELEIATRLEHEESEHRRTEYRMADPDPLGKGVAVQK